MTVEEALLLLIFPAESIEHPLGGESGGQGQIAPCNAFGYGHKIRFYSLMQAGEEGPGTSKTCSYLISDQEYVVPGRQFTDPPGVSLRESYHPAGTLYQRLHNDGGHLLVIAVHDLFHLWQAGHLAPGVFLAQVATIAVRRIDLDALEEKGLIYLVEQVDATDAH
ncbi:MAG: hypothetical protein DDT36_01652 [Firmicutes bacterium]|nr:hypothetical protein [Bacillota bacterium]